ncbi:MAG: T9SS type A sorting domain-containing protein [Ignavibacteria bacterium]|nr:T9SS type A sorting domain-containing protein [Ignavibacteria bacterium]
MNIYNAILPLLAPPDTVPPTTISDLSTIDTTSSSLTLMWTAPLDTTQNGVVGYDIRMSLTPITDSVSFYNAQQLAFSGNPGTPGSTETLVIEGLDFNTTYYFAIRSRDLWNNISDLSNNPSGTTYGAPTASVNPDSVHANLVNNTTLQETVTLSNTSAVNSTLDYDITLENNTFPEGMVKLIQVPKNNNIEGLSTDKDNPGQNHGQSIDGSGGPDAFGYEWIDSDEPNGPQYVWEDITTTGTAVTNWVPTGTFEPEDEGYAGPFPFGFNFKFYGNTKTQVYVSSNGYLLFNTINEDTYVNDPIPDPAIPNEFIAPFWADFDGTEGGTVHYKQDGNRFIVQFTNWPHFFLSGTLVTFQVVLYSSGKILVYYNNMIGTLDIETVGIENGDGTIGLQVAYNANYVHNNLALQFSAEPDWLGAAPLSGTLYNGNSVDIDLEFRTEDFPVGDYSMDLVISSNDPVNPTITVPVTMTIVPIPVELTSLSAEAEKNSVTLKWTTATETNNQGFEIERQVGSKQYTVGNQWETVGFIEGKGNTTERHSYIFGENDLGIGKYSYRLKQMDYDGSYEYSDEVEVDIAAPEEYTLKQNYPNPFNPMTTIEYSLPENTEVRIDIYNSLGELVMTLINNTMDAGYQKINFDASSLPSGTYIYQIKAKGQTKTFVDSKKMLLVK